MTSNRGSMQETMLCYVEGSKHHLPGPNPGTPYTVCGLDAGAMQRDEHPITHAALWCSDCMRAHLGYAETSTSSTVQSG